MMINFAAPQSREIVVVCVALALVFCLMPVLGIFLATMLALSYKNVPKVYMYFLFLLLSIYMGVIDSTKIPETDQFMYYDAYRLVPHRTFLQNLMGIYGSFSDYTTKEMGFGLFNVVGYYLTGGSYPLFVLLGMLLLYMLYYDGIYRYFHYVKVECPDAYVVAGILMLTFFTQFFNLTIHIERQYIATGFVIYALIRTIVDNKVPWIFVVIGLSMHTATGIFVPIFLLRQFKKDLDLKFAIVVIGLLAIAMSSLNYILGVFSGGDSYAMDRLQDMGEAGREDRMSMNLVLMLALPMTLISLKNLVWSYHSFVKDEVLLYLSYFFILIFALANPNNTMQYRFFMMTYSFIPFIFPMFIRNLTVVCKFYLFAVSVFLIGRFYITFDDIVFKFAPCSDVLTMNIFGLFNYHDVI